MGHLRDPDLHQWQPNKPISAAVLNHDFGVLWGMIEQAAGLALTPDPDATEALQRVGNAETRIGALERYNRSTARERGEREYTPLATFGALLQQVSALRDPLREATEALRAEIARREAAEAALAARLALVESTPKPPPAPSVEAFEQLRAELAEARAEASSATGHAVRMHAQLAQYRAQVEAAEARYMPRPEFAGLIERMDAFEASTAAADVAAMRAEVARLQQLIADTDRKQLLHRLFTPRSAFAYLLRRVERLEGRPA